MKLSLCIILLIISGCTTVNRPDKFLLLSLSGKVTDYNNENLSTPQYTKRTTHTVLYMLSMVAVSYFVASKIPNYKLWVIPVEDKVNDILNGGEVNLELKKSN